MLVTVLERLNVAASLVKRAIGDAALLDSVPANESAPVRTLIADELRAAAALLSPVESSASQVTDEETWDL